MKKGFPFISVLLVAIMLLTALPVSAADNPTVYMDFRYSDAFDTIIEIPHIAGGGKAAENINARLDEIKDKYKKYINPTDQKYPVWAEVLAYICVTERYINIMITCNEYPTYGYDGEMHTFIYDKTTGKEFTLTDAMKSNKYTEATFTDRFKDYIKKELRENPVLDPRTNIISCVPVGFRVRENGMVDYYLSTEVDYKQDANLRKHYIFRNGIIYERSDGTNPDLRIKYRELEHMKPPLSAELTLLKG